MKIKTVELVGVALDYAVAIATDKRTRVYIGYFSVLTGNASGHDHISHFTPTARWSDVGPLVDQYKVWLSPPVNDPHPDPDMPDGWDAEIYDADGMEKVAHIIGAPTARLAVCRAIVTARLGETVDIPDALVQEQGI